MATTSEGIVESAAMFRGKAYSTLISLKVVIDLADVDPLIEDDEATLESTDGEYKRTLKVAVVGERTADENIQLLFSDVIPGKRYTLTYDLKKDAYGNELGQFDMFYSALIEPEMKEGSSETRESAED